MPLMAYCDPALNFSVRYVYLWCGRLAEMLAMSNSIEGEFEPSAQIIQHIAEVTFPVYVGYDQLPGQ